MSVRSRLKTEFLNKLKADEVLQSMLGKEVGISTAGIKSNLDRDSERLCLPYYQKAIRKVLGLPDGIDIAEDYIAQPELSNHE